MIVSGFFAGLENGASSDTLRGAVLADAAILSGIALAAYSYIAD